MYSLGDEYATLLKEASSYARRQIASQISAAEQAEKDRQLRQWILLGGAGLAGVLLLILIVRR